MTPVPDLADAAEAVDLAQRLVDQACAAVRDRGGIDANQVDMLMTSQAATYNAAIQADAAEGNAMGVGGTPSILVGKQMFVGGQSYETLKAAIDAVLAGH